MPNFTPICASQGRCPHAPAELQILSQAPNTERLLTGADKGPRKKSWVKDCLPPAPISYWMPATKMWSLRCCLEKSSLDGLPCSLLILLFSPGEGDSMTHVVSRAVATTQRVGFGCRGIMLTKDKQVQARHAAQRCSWWVRMVDANPPRGLALTLALSRLLSSYPVFMAVSKGGSGPKFTLLSRFCISLPELFWFFPPPSVLFPLFSLFFVSPPSPLSHFSFADLFFSSAFI